MTLYCTVILRLVDSWKSDLHTNRLHLAIVQLCAKTLLHMYLSLFRHRPCCLTSRLCCTTPNYPYLCHFFTAPHCVVSFSLSWWWLCVLNLLFSAVGCWRGVFFNTFFSICWGCVQLYSRVRVFLKASHWASFWFKRKAWKGKESMSTALCFCTDFFYCNFGRLTDPAFQGLFLE